MANHKRKKPPSSRAGCAMCKPWKKGKVSGKDNEAKPSLRRQMASADERSQLFS